MALFGGPAGIVAAGITFIGSVIQGLFSKPPKTFEEQLQSNYIDRLTQVRKERLGEQRYASDIASAPARAQSAQNAEVMRYAQAMTATGPTTDENGNVIGG